MKTNPNDSAFAAMSFDSEGRVNEHSEGLTKREYFAIKCLQGLVTGNNPTHPIHPDDCKRAVEYADALITELNKAK